MKRLHHLTSIAGRAGTDYLKLRPFLRFIGLYRRISTQTVSPVFAEKTVEYGIQFAHLRFAFSRTYRVWTDGKTPKIERGFRR